jgi:DNA-binding transcriptional ArsR family regulator
MASNTVFAAVSNPERRRILDLLREGEMTAGELVAAFPDLPQPAVSRHLRVLREAGLVRVSPRAQQRIYALEPGRLREVDSWVSTYRVFWSRRLALLSGHLDENPKSRKKAWPS